MIVAQDISGDAQQKRPRVIPGARDRFICLTHNGLQLGRWLRQPLPSELSPSKMCLTPRLWDRASCAKRSSSLAFGGFPVRIGFARWISVYKLLLILSFGVFLTGCASSSVRAPARHFDFSKDTFSYANGLVWEYRY